jgi:hypothetical protein
MTEPTQDTARLYLSALDLALAEWEQGAKLYGKVWGERHRPASVHDLAAIAAIRRTTRAQLAAAVERLPPETAAQLAEPLDDADTLRAEFMALRPAHAWYWSSHHPERRAEAAAADYVAQVAGWRSVRTPTRMEDERHRRALLSRWAAYLSAEGRTASAYVAGPAKFNSARNDRRMEVARRRLAALLEFARRSAATDTGIRQGADDAVDRLNAKLWAEQQTRGRKIAAANQQTRIRNLIARLDQLQRRASQLDELPPAYRAVISVRDYRFGAPSQVEADVVIDREADRILIRFPRDNTIGAFLKSKGFKWAPSKQAWSRQITENALTFLRYAGIVPTESPPAPAASSDLDAPETVYPIRIADLDAPDVVEDADAAPIDDADLEEAAQLRESYAAADPVAPAPVEQPEAPPVEQPEAPLARVLSFPARPAPAAPPAPPPDLRAEQLEQARASVRQLDDQLAELRLSLDRVQREQTPQRARPLAAELNSRIDVLEVERDRAAMNVARLEGAERSLDPVPDLYKPVAGWWYGLSDDARAQLKAAIARDAARHPFAQWANAAATRYEEIEKALPRAHLRAIARELFIDFYRLGELATHVAKQGYPQQLTDTVQDKKARAMVAAVFYARRLGYQPPDPPPFGAESHVEPPTPYEGLPAVADITPPPPAPSPKPRPVDPAERDPHRLAAARADAIRAARHYRKEAAAARAENNLERAVIADADAETYEAEAVDLQKRLAAAARAISPPPVEQPEAPPAPPPTLPDPPLFSAPPVETVPTVEQATPIRGRAREIVARLAPRASLDDVRRVGCTDDAGARRIMRRLVKLGAAIEAGPDVWTLDARTLDACPPSRARATKPSRACVGECGKWTAAPRTAPRWLAALGPMTPAYDSEGRAYSLRWAFARADQLGETWHASNVGGRSDPAYDRELQARDRSAAASDAQIAAIASRLDLARWVAPSSAATDSAPIVWLDDAGHGHVVSGNGRTAAWTIAQPSALTVRDVSRSRWTIPATVARMLPDDPTAPAPLIPIRLLGDPAARDPAARTSTRAEAVQLAGASQAAAAGALSTAERAVSSVRSLGLRWQDSPALEWASPLNASNVNRFIEANPAFASWAFAPLDPARSLTVQAEPTAKTQHLRDVLIGMLPASALGVGVGEAPVDRAMLGALPAILTLESRILRGAAPASWSLLQVLPEARAWSRRVGPNKLRQLASEAEAASRQETIFGAPDLDVDDGGLLAVALGATLARASGRTDPESAAAEYLERVLASAPDPRQVDLFGGPPLDPADALAAVAKVKLRRNPRSSTSRDLSRLHTLARRWHWGRYKRAKTVEPTRTHWQPEHGFALGELAGLTVDGQHVDVPEGFLLCADRDGDRARLFVVPPLPFSGGGVLERIEYLAEKGTDGPSWYVHDFEGKLPRVRARDHALDLMRAGSRFSVDTARGIVG